jgi:5,10-methylene-tetrahydrofolate dehydrogenase/methenyl tetrahydrofolate cyclohydrolase
MIEGLQHQQNMNSEMEKYINEMQAEQSKFNFVTIGFNVDMREAEKRYMEEWKNDIGGVKTAQMTFSQWLDGKKYEATKFYIKHSDFYLGF